MQEQDQRVEIKLKGRLSDKTVTIEAHIADKRHAIAPLWIYAAQYAVAFESLGLMTGDRLSLVGCDGPVGVYGDNDLEWEIYPVLPMM